ncbi:hypothetical protein U0070_026548, partial [Myodes glareolus]
EVHAEAQTDAEDQAGEAKPGIFASNRPALRKPERECCVMLDKVGVHHYGGNNTVWASCGKDALWLSSTWVMLAKCTERDALNALGLKHYCCRRVLLAHVDLIEKLLNYALLENTQGDLKQIFIGIIVSSQTVLIALRGMRIAYCPKVKTSILFDGILYKAAIHLKKRKQLPGPKNLQMRLNFFVSRQSTTTVFRLFRDEEHSLFSDTRRTTRPCTACTMPERKKKERTAYPKKTALLGKSPNELTIPRA